MKNLKLYFLMICMMLSIAACNDDADEITPINADIAGSSAMSMTSGTIVSNEMNTSTSGDYYEVDVQTSVGAIVEFEFYVADGSLKEIEGTEAPFDYEVNPGMGLIPFSQAKGIALTERPFVLMGWSLEKDSSSSVWTYRFEIENDSDSYSVRINAETGQIISNS